ncbi:serine/threonine protein kinase [Paenibacillus aurantius]|uniref:Serine/threonine protein kinase n=1 Tax=Paenibacillus aurantius TaxID=2918900 RepID=A0AA96LHK4_9BACL|nr:serine/threonine protein kinase [Paenibacillus aurantius]WNQ14062.1 serine/threonine protein kinase [Paenibacillus aurantius]
MKPDWREADEPLRKITITGSELNEMVEITGSAKGLHCIGIGTDAAAFTYDGTPGYAYKVYSDLALPKKEIEKQVYERLAGIPFFPKFYGEGEHYLVISYEEGPTLHECLTSGIPVPEQVIRDVEEARTLVRSRGLNPRDIHLKNVLLQNGRAKILDVSEYVRDGDDKRWEHLVWAYRLFYPSVEGSKVPAWVLDSIKKGYNRLDQANGSIEEFAQRISQLFSKFMK